jgi:hypothetical protein
MDSSDSKDMSEQYIDDVNNNTDPKLKHDCQSSPTNTPPPPPTSFHHLLSQHIPAPTPTSNASDRADFSHSRDLMARLCAANPQFTASVLEDYIRPVFRDGDVVLEIECGNNAALM